MTFPSRNAAIEPVCRSNSTITYSTRGGVVVPGLPMSLAPKYLPDGCMDGSTRSQADPSAAIDRGGVEFDELFVAYATRSASIASAHRKTDRAVRPTRTRASQSCVTPVRLRDVPFHWCGLEWLEVGRTEKPVHIVEMGAGERVVER